MFPLIFQWFILLTTIYLACSVGVSVIRFIVRPVPDCADRPAEQYGGVRRPFSTYRREAFWHIILLAALSRIILYGVAFLFSRIFMAGETGFFTSLPDLWQRSDAPHYISIVENGYVNVGEDRVFLVFLPFYPMLVKLFSVVFGSAVFSGILVSQLSFAAACALIYELALIAGQDEDTAFRAAKYAVFFPASFFINGSFSEGLFLLLSVLFFHCLLRKKYAAAALFGMFAAFTRYYGLLLAVPYAVECARDLAAMRPRRAAPQPDSGELAGAWQPSESDEPYAAQPDAYDEPHDGDPPYEMENELNEDDPPYEMENEPYSGSPQADSAGVTRRAAAVRRALPALLIPAGTGLFLLNNYIVSGNFLQFLVYQREHWNQRFTFFFNNMRDLAANAMNFDLSVSASLFIPQIIFIILFVALMIYGVRTGFRASLLAYLGIYYLVSISAYWMLSFPRYLFGAAPLFSLTAAAGRGGKLADALITLFCAAGLIFYTAAYACGHHVY